MRKDDPVGALRDVLVILRRFSTYERLRILRAVLAYFGETL